MRTCGVRTQVHRTSGSRKAMVMRRTPGCLSMVASMAFGFIMLTVGVLVGLSLQSSDPLRTGSSCPPPEVAPKFGVFWEAWDLADRYYVDQSMIDPTKQTYGAIEGMLASLGDPGHTRFLTPEQYKAEQESLSGKFDGIGAHLGDRNGRPTILAPLPDTPAERAGLKAGDIVLKVDGKDVEGMHLSEVVAIVRGPAGTTVTLTILHADEATPVEISVVRASINAPNVMWTMVPGKPVAHILLMQFSERAGSEVGAAIAAAVRQGATSLILDLRNNSGGLRDEAVAVAGHFIASGNVLIEVDSQGKRTEYPVKSEGRATDLPLVVLVNENSASSAEILAGALQDHDRARIAGTTTAGTGTVLSIFNLSDGSSVFLGTSGWLTPNGREIWRKGIEPDRPVQLTAGTQPLLPVEEQRMSEGQFKQQTDNQLTTALELLGH